MKKTIAVLMIAVLLLGASAACASAAEPGPADQVEDQLFVVAGFGMDKTTATVSMHERDENGSWKQILSTPGFVGKNGLCLDADHKEGCGQTPVGVYHFNRAFGPGHGRYLVVRRSGNPLQRNGGYQGLSGACQGRQ